MRILAEILSSDSQAKDSWLRSHQGHQCGLAKDVHLNVKPGFSNLSSIKDVSSQFKSDIAKSRGACWHGTSRVS